MNQLAGVIGSIFFPEAEKESGRRAENLHREIVKAPEFVKYTGNDRGVGVYAVGEWYRIDQPGDFISWAGHDPAVVKANSPRAAEVLRRAVEAVGGIPSNPWLHVVLG